MEVNIDIHQEHGHYEAYINGEFFCSADTHNEAAKEVETYMAERKTKNESAVA